MSKSNLEFRKIKSLDFLYEISEDGRIFRNAKSKKQIKIFLDMHHSDKGYYTAFICFKGKVTRCTIHKLVAECWLGDRPEGLQVDHIDRNTHNNHYTNLRYVTQSEQMKNRVLSDRIITRATANCLKYTKEGITVPVIAKRGDEVIEFSSCGKCCKALAEEYGVTKGSISWKLRERRKHIYDYDIEYPKCRDLTRQPYGARKSPQ